MSRPRIYKKERADLICQRLALGESLNSICSEKGMPAKSTVMLWVVRNEGADADGKGGFSDQYMRACEARTLSYLEDIIDIADDASDDVRMVERKSGEMVAELDGDAIRRAQLKISTRQWVMGRMNPKKFSDRVKLSNDDEGPLTVVIQK